MHGAALKTYQSKHELLLRELRGQLHLDRMHSTRPTSLKALSFVVGRGRGGGGLRSAQTMRTSSGGERPNAQRPNAQCLM